MAAHDHPAPGDDGASAIQDDLARRIADLADLHAFAGRLTQAAELPALLDEALDAVMRVQGAELGAVLLFDPARGGLVPTASRGFAEDYGRLLEEAVGSLRPASGITGVAFARRRSHFVADLDDDPASAPYLALARRAGYRAGGAVPLLDRDGAAIGTLTTYFRVPHRPSERVGAALCARYGDAMAIIVMSAGCDATAIAEQLGARATLRKPFDLVELLDVVRHALGDRRPEGQGGPDGRRAA